MMTEFKFLSNKKFNIIHNVFWYTNNFISDHLMCFISTKNSKGATKRDVFINIPEFSQFQEFDFGIQLTLLSRPA